MNIWTISLEKEMGEIEPLLSYQRILGVKLATPIGLYLENHEHWHSYHDPRSWALVGGSIWASLHGH